MSWHKKKLCCVDDEAARILYKPLALSIWMKQLPPSTTVCKTQIALIFSNILNKTASLSCYVILTAKILEYCTK